MSVYNPTSSRVRGDRASRIAEPRAAIIATYAEWTAMSALRASAPIRSRSDVYRALRAVNFKVLFDTGLGPIGRDDFDEWHEEAVRMMLVREPRLTVGWATKILNVYLKTRVYVAAEGRQNLMDMIHPPIDGGLWLGLSRQFAGQPEILAMTNCVSRIKGIVDYDCYRRIIDGCLAAAALLACRLIEVEQLWTGTEFSQSA
jgi:hypothetical protein